MTTTTTVSRRHTTLLETGVSAAVAAAENARLRVMSNRTAWFVTDRIDPLLRNDLIRWDRNAETMRLSVLSAPIVTADRSALDSVRWLSTTLGVSLPEIRKAVGIAERTYQDWKARRRTPRLSSLGSLWSLVQVVEDLQHGHDDVAAWFRADPTLFAALRRSDFPFLASYDLSKRTIVSPSTGRAEIIAAVGPEPDLLPAAPRRPRGRRIPQVPIRTQRRGASANPESDAG